MTLYYRADASGSILFFPANRSCACRAELPPNSYNTDLTCVRDPLCSTTHAQKIALQSASCRKILTDRQIQKPPLVCTAACASMIYHLKSFRMMGMKSTYLLYSKWRGCPWKPCYIYTKISMLLQKPVSPCILKLLFYFKLN